MSKLEGYTEIADHIRTKAIYEGLELEDLGIELEEVTDSVRLFEETGLNLDSVDALDIIASVQRDFGLTFPDVDQDFMVAHCATVSLLAKTVQRFREESACQ
ncbi:MAG: acyl carrier protein [Desulfuromusa sp.]|nr:acyl carrier protein [Desulfuromusa sp.]